MPHFHNRALIAATIVTTLVSGCAIADFTTYAGQLSPISSKPASSYRIKTGHFYG
jgi:hypothetical protein